MQKAGTAVVFSPSDLNGFLECEHLVQLERAREEGDALRPRDAHAELLAEKGREHERAWLDRFLREFRQVVSLEAPAGHRAWQDDAARTLDAMRAGAEVIYQGVLIDEEWHGISDFLVRVETPSPAFGAWSYEAWDTKLARHSKPYFILQLCYYTEQIARLQGVEPVSMHVILGTGERESLRYADFAAYYRAVRRRFLAAAREGRATQPYPVAHCRLCHHARTCEEGWERENHLSLVDSIRRDQVEKLNAHGIVAVDQLARLDLGTRLGIGAVALRRLVHQAVLQTHHRRTGQHRYELLPVDAQNGFRLLPAPNAGDIFFDMEGYPYFEPAAGLEYLFGFSTLEGDGVTQPFRAAYHAFNASNRQEEKHAFEQFVDFVTHRLTQFPDLHVYHYASYEQTALKRLMSEHATREDEMDALLRREVFVDLYQVVRQSVRISHPSYSIKKVRQFFMSGAGAGAVADAGDSMIEFERYLRTRDPKVLDAIVRYNEEDCLSTVMLRDWLLERRQGAERACETTIAWKTPGDPTLTPERVQEDEDIRRRREALQARGDAASSMLANLLNYHRREAKPAYWAYFDRQKKSLDELLDDTDAIAYLERVTGEPPTKVDRSFVTAFAFPAQEFKLQTGKSVEDPFTGRRVATLAWVDAAAGRLGLKRGSAFGAGDAPAAIVPCRPIDTPAQRQALCRVADAVLAGSSAFAAARALLGRDLPKMGSGTISGASIQTLDLARQKALVASLDSSYLFIQGPPGSGKTYTGARLIVSLIAAGRRVGVAATSHKAIHNLLAEIEAVALEERVTFRGVKKCTEDDGDTQFDGRSFVNIDSAKACEECTADLIAGTAWLFAREGMEAKVDYLFIDEAGQVPLADALAMATAARNVVLLGDPQQLPHVTQGIHPDGSGCSVLEHLLAGAHTVSPDRGVFLAQSWRMHPHVCGFISELAYDGRLESAPGRELQRIDSPETGPRASGLGPLRPEARGPSHVVVAGTGLRYIPVAHEGNAQQSPEEAAAIAEQVRLLLAGGSFTDHKGATRPLTAKDILVVTPYNMQVRCLREQLPEGVEVGTVDKFQGREAAVVFFSMASSSGDDVPRGLEFLLNRNRFNVAVSRAKCLSVLVCSPRLLEARCRSVAQMRLVNAICRFVEAARSERRHQLRLAPGVLAST